jgi:hypothetical protein
MPRLIHKQNKQQEVNDFSFIPLPPSLHKEEDIFLKACRKRSPPSRRHTIGSSPSPAAHGLLNELLSSLMVPFRMTDAGEEEPIEGRYADDNNASAAAQRPLNAVSFDDGKDTRVTTDPTSFADDKRSAFSAVSSSYQEPSSAEQQEGQSEYRNSADTTSQGMPAPAVASPQGAASASIASAVTSNRTQFKQGTTPRHHHPRSRQEEASAASNPYPFPHYGHPQQQPHPYPYDYSGYYHPQSEVDLSSSSAAFHPQWPDQGYNYSQSYQDYAHSYYSSSPYHHMHPSQYHAPMYEDPYHMSSRHPHSAPPSYHRGHARTTPPLGNAPDTKHPHQYKETPSAVTEGTTPSKQSPPLELSPEMSALFGDSGSDDERKPAAKKAGDGIQARRPVHSQDVPNHPPHDDFEPIPFWNAGPSAIAPEHQYQDYPIAASAPSSSHGYCDFVVDPTMVGLPPGHRYSSTHAQSSVASATSSHLPISAGGEGSSWEKRFAELLEFRSKHGHCEVPQNYKENTSLGIWVNKQRMEQKLRIEGKNSSLNDARLQRLESVGFRWAKRKGQVSWDEKYEELKAYKRKYGNCHVPTKYKENTALGRWVSTQRAEYKKYCEGEKSNMTADKIRRLESIGFAWFMAL